MTIEAPIISTDISEWIKPRSYETPQRTAKNRKKNPSSPVIISIDNTPATSATTLDAFLTSISSAFSRSTQFSSQNSKILYEVAWLLDMSGKNSWGFSGFLEIPRDSWGFLWIPRDSKGFLRILCSQYLGVSWDSSGFRQNPWGFLGILRDSSKSVRGFWSVDPLALRHQRQIMLIYESCFFWEIGSPRRSKSKDLWCLFAQLPLHW